MSVVDHLRRNDPSAPSSAVVDLLQEDFTDEVIAEALLGNTVVTELLLIVNGWQKHHPMGCPEFCQALTQSKTLQKITIVQDEEAPSAEHDSMQPAPAIFVRQFLQALQKAKPSLQVVKLWGLQVWAEDLATFLRSTKAKSILLSELTMKLLGLDERAALMDAVANNCTIECLQLESMQNGVQPILTGLQYATSTHLHSLKLTSQTVPGESSQVLRNLLEHAPAPLISFEWTDVGMIHDEETTTFANTAAGLIDSRSVTDLTFVSCHFNNTRLADIFISILFRKRNLTSLTLTDACQFAAVPNNNNKLVEVQNAMQGMLLRPDAALRQLQFDTATFAALYGDCDSLDAFLSAVASSVALRRLDIGWFRGDNNVQLLHVLMRHIPNFLYLTELECGADCYDLQQPLLAAIRDNGSLRKVTFHGSLLNHNGQKQLNEYLARNSKNHAVS